MSATFVKCLCQKCRQPFEIDSDYLGSTLQCPQCYEQTLAIAGIVSPAFVPPILPKKRRIPLWAFVLALVVLAFLCMRWFIGPLLSAHNPESGDSISGLLMIIALAAIYFFPAFMGRKKRNSSAIFLLNLFLGWTFVGWVIAIVWAATVDAPQNNRQ